MRKELYIVNQRENIIAFARLYKENKSETIFNRIVETYRIYIDAAESYLSLDYSLWTLEKETNMISKLPEISDLEVILHSDIEDNYRSHEPETMANMH